MMRTKTQIIAIAFVCLAFANLSHAYVDLAPTLAKVIGDSRTIAVVEVVEYDRASHTVVIRQVDAIKGEISADPIRHDVASGDGAIVPRQILQWASPGSRGVMFSSRATALICVGQAWYQVRAGGGDAWKLGADRPDLPLAYCGSVSRLIDGVKNMVAGKDAILTVAAYGADDEASSFDLALNRSSLPELVRVQRIRANLKMPGMVTAASGNPAYFLGAGSVDAADLPTLVANLKSSDPLVRAEAADDLRRLERKAGSAVELLTKLLSDSSSNVRFSAAAALLRIDPKGAHALDLLESGLKSSDASVRRDAARYAGLSGPAAAPLAETLAALLRDSDESVRITALQAIATLGPAAAKAAPAVEPFLDDKDYMIDAADALGRIGAAARPALKHLAPMLSSDQPAVRWAGVRAMSQIGGPDAHPAVEFIINHFKSGKATEVEGYNMMIYLALLGPVASDALPTIQSTRIKNPVLPGATTWAINADKGFPWLGGFGGRGFGGPGGGRGPGGPGGGADISTLIYQAYVRELGDRLRPSAILLAQKIMDGSAGDVPAWGYDMLAAGGNDVVQTLTSHLGDTDIVMRERATVALGHMGPAALAGKDRVEAALLSTSSEREKLLIQWCLRSMDAG